MTVVDSSVWIDFLNARSTEHTSWLRQPKRRASLALTELILIESLQGIRDDVRYTSARSFFADFPVLRSASEQVAIASADRYRWLRKRGITIRKTIDCVTATFCIQEGHSLLHNDRDFEPFESYFDLKVIKPFDDRP